MSDRKIGKTMAGSIVAHTLPSGLGKPATRALVAAGYTRLEELTHVTEAKLLKLHGVGPKAVVLLRNALDAQGLAFADSDEDAP